MESEVETRSLTVEALADEYILLIENNFYQFAKTKNLPEATKTAHRLSKEALELIFNRRIISKLDGNQEEEAKFKYNRKIAGLNLSYITADLTDDEDFNMALKEVYTKVKQTN